MWVEIRGRFQVEKKNYDRRRIDFRETRACWMPFVVKDAYTKLHENPTNGLVATVGRIQTDRRMDMAFIFYFVNST